MLGAQLANGFFAALMVLFNTWLIAFTPVWTIDRREDEN
jgi:hypothetical protein